LLISRSLPNNGSTCHNMLPLFSGSQRVKCVRIGLYIKSHTGFEVLKAVVMKSSIFWDIKPCSPFEIESKFPGCSTCSKSLYQLGSLGTFLFVGNHKYRICFYLSSQVVKCTRIKFSEITEL
jgi:hypothetical protein